MNTKDTKEQDRIEDMSLNNLEQFKQEQTMSQPNPVVSIEYDHRYWYIIKVQGDTLVRVTKTYKQKPRCRKAARKVAKEEGLEFIEALGKQFLKKAVITRKPFKAVDVDYILACPNCDFEDWEITGWDEATNKVFCECHDCGHSWID